MQPAYQLRSPYSLYSRRYIVCCKKHFFHLGLGRKNSFLAWLRRGLQQRGDVVHPISPAWSSSEHTRSCPYFHAFLTCGALRVRKCTTRARLPYVWTFLRARWDQESIDLAASPLSAPLPANHSHKSHPRTRTPSRCIYMMGACGVRGPPRFIHISPQRRRRITYSLSRILHVQPCPGFGIKHRPAVLQGNFV